MQNRNGRGRTAPLLHSHMEPVGRLFTFRSQMILRTLTLMDLLCVYRCGTYICIPGPKCFSPAISSPSFSVPHFLVLHFPPLHFWSCIFLSHIFRSSIFQSCIFGPAFSGPLFSSTLYCILVPQI